MCALPSSASLTRPVKRAKASQTRGPNVKLQPIIYTTEMDHTVDWYAMVLNARPAYRSDVWTSFSVGGANLGIHRVDQLPNGSRVELSLVADVPLEELLRDFAAHTVTVERGIQEETFGRSLVVKDPDGSLVQISEHAHG